MSLVGRGHCCIRKVTRPCTQADVLSSSEAGRMLLISEMLSGSGAILGLALADALAMAGVPCR